MGGMQKLSKADRAAQSALSYATAGNGILGYFYPTLTMGSVGGFIMGFATGLTDSLETYAPLSWVIAACIGFGAFLVATRYIISIKTESQRERNEYLLGLSREDRDIEEIRDSISKVRVLIRNFGRNSNPTGDQFISALRESPHFDVVRPWLSDNFIKHFNNNSLSKIGDVQSYQRIRSILEIELDKAYKATSPRRSGSEAQADVSDINH